VGEERYSNHMPSQMLQKYPTKGVSWEVPGAGPNGRRARLPLVCSEGTGKCGVALVGEAAGNHEQKDGLPFRPWAEAGAVLANAIRTIGLPRDGYLITNTVWWQPHNNDLVGQPWEAEAKGICRPWNQALFVEKGIKCLVALGATAFYELTGRTEISVLRDRGYVFQAKPEYGGLPVVLTYHPSFLARGSKEKSQETKAKTEKGQSGGMALLSVLIRDIKLGNAIALKGLTGKDLGNKIPHLERYEEIAGTDRQGYVLNAGPEDWDRMIADAKANPELAISYDYETNFTYATTDESEYEHAMREVNQVQASLRPGQAIVSGWEGWVLEKLTLLLECMNDKLDYNGRGFDRNYNDAMLIRRIDGWLGQWQPAVKELIDKSIPVGNYHDLMQMWHHWEPDLPQGLQYACSMLPEISLAGAWKYMFTEDERLYGAMDVDYPQRLWRWLKKNLAGLSHPISKVNLLQGYRRQVNELSAKSLDQMQRRGIPVDESERMQVWRYLQGLKKQKIAQIQGMVPDCLRPPKQKLGLKTVPLWLRKQSPEEVAKATSSGVAIHPKSGKRFEIREFKLPDSPMPVARWCELKEFNPNSTFQIRDYIRWKRQEEIRQLLDKPCRHGLGYQRAQDCPDCQARAAEQAKWKVPKKFRSDDETTDKKELRRLNVRLKDPIIELAIEYKEIDKMAGTYVGGPGEDSPEGQELAKKLQETGKGKAQTQGWRPNPKTGRVHPFFTTAPATGQLSSRNPNCFSDDTEVLTEDGWKLFKDLGPYTKVAQYNPKSGDISLARPDGYIRKWHQGPMVHIHTEQQLDMLMTPDHRCLVRNRRTKAWKWVEAKYYPQDYQQPQAGIYKGGRTKLSRAEIIFLAALQADGHVLKSCSAIEFGLTKIRKQQRLEEALRDLGWAYSRYDKEDVGRRYYIHAGEVPEWMRQRKQFDSWIMDLDQESFALLAEEIWFWDGYLEGRSMYSSSEKSNADWAQILTCLSGRRAKVRKYWNDKLNRPNWQVDAVDQDYSLTTNLQPQEHYYQGWVYCVTMPQGTVIVRRNGKVAITGNCQNFPKHNLQFAKLLRGMVKAPPGYRIIEGDFKSFHVLTTGFEAKDELYMRLAKLDMHSFFTAGGLLKLYKPDEMIKMSDKDMMALFKELRGDHKARYKIAASPDLVDFKFVRDKQGKPTILGYGFGMQAARLWHENQEFIAGKQDAQRLITTLDELFPITHKWKSDIQHQAHQQGYLISAHGYIRRFNCVLRYKPLHRLDAPRIGQKVLTDRSGQRWLVENGDDAEAAIAFLPANDAFGRIKEAMIGLEDCGAGEEIGICNQIHDSLIAVCRDGLERAAIMVMHRKMQEESRYLILPSGRGLECEAEFSISGLGESWAQCEEIKDLGGWLNGTGKLAIGS